jgi:hypothetical protein
MHPQIEKKWTVRMEVTGNQNDTTEIHCQFNKQVYKYRIEKRFEKGIVLLTLKEEQDGVNIVWVCGTKTSPEGQKYKNDYQYWTCEVIQLRTQIWRGITRKSTPKSGVHLNLNIYQRLCIVAHKSY